MKFSIAVRLFLAVLLTSLLVAAGGLWMLRASTEQAFARYVAEIELNRADRIVNELARVYASAGQWPLPDEDMRPEWLHRHFDRLAGQARPRGPDLPGPDDAGPAPIAWQPPHPPGDGPPPDRMDLIDRAGLTDATGQYLSGIPPSADDPRRPIMVNGKVVGYLTLARTLDPRDDISRAFLADQARNLVLVGAFCIVLSALAAALLAAHFRRPIHQLEHAAAELAEGRFDTRLPVTRSDELGALAGNVNRLAGMLEQHEASRRQWVADTSHELRTPVSVLRMQIEAILDGVRKPETALFQSMHRQIIMLGKLIEDLYLLAQADVNLLHCEPELIAPWEVVTAEAEALRGRFSTARLLLSLESGNPELRLLSDPARLQQLTSNLLQNSLRYTDPGGVVRISTVVTEGEWILRVDDSAPGVPAEALERLGERFFRVEQSRSRAYGGSGLGLALCQRLAGALGGRLEFAHSMLGGLRVSVHLPRRTS